MPPNRVTVLIVDDDPKVLRSLERLLLLNGYFVQTFSSSTAFLNYPLPTGPACALVDVQMPGLSGLEVQSVLAKKMPELPVIFITGYGDIPKAVQAMKAGAADFLTKPIEEKRLLNALKRALAQEERVRHEHQDQAVYRTRFDHLTARERQVCALVVEGKLNKQIAAELDICEKTVKVHRGRVMKKMKVESLAELVRVIVKIGGAAVKPDEISPAAASGSTSKAAAARDQRGTIRP